MAVNFPDSPTNGQVHVVDGVNFVYNTSNTYWQKQGTSVPPVITGHVLPDTTLTYDLGSATHKFKDLYMDGNTLHLGDETIKSGADGIEFAKMKVGSGANSIKFEVDSSGKLKKESTVGGVKQPEVDDVESIADLSDVTLDVVAETLIIGLDDPTAGHGTDWQWTWTSGPLAYARATITNSTESSVPLYKGGTYTMYNFAAHTIHGAMTQTHKIHLKWIEGQGIQNNVSWSTETLNVTNITVAGVNGGAATEVQRLIVNVPTTITLPSLVAPDVAYDVAYANAGAYTFSGTRSGDNPTIGPLYKGGTYTFNLDSTLSGHPFYLSTIDSGEGGYTAAAYAGEYTSGVTGSRNESGTLKFTVPSDAPSTLYYQCGNHATMKGTINIKDLAVPTNSAGNYLLSAQHSQEGHATEIEIRPKPTIPNQMCLVYDSTLSKFVPQDMGEYIGKTAVFKEKIGDVASEQITAKVSDGTVTTLAAVKSATILIANISQQGDLSVITGSARWYAPFGLTITNVSPKLATAADASVALVVKKNGAAQSNITIASGATTAVLTGVNNTWTMVEGDYLTMDVTSIGTDAKGKDLVVQFKYTQT